MRIAIISFGVAAVAVALSACSSVEPLEVAAAPQGTGPKLVQTDQAVIAQKVGTAGLESTPLAWANPSTGSAGVIERIATNNGGGDCRTFVGTEQTLDGVSELSGLACRTSDAHWKLHITE